MSSTQSSLCDLLITGGRILDLDADSGVLDDAGIAVRDGAIVGLGPRAEVEAAWRATRVIDATEQAITPGFIDAHVHLGAFLGAGRPYQRSTGPGPFSGAGRVEVVLPMVARMCSMTVPAELVAAVVGPPLAAMLKAGITSVVDAGGPGVDGWSPPPSGWASARRSARAWPTCGTTSTVCSPIKPIQIGCSPTPTRPSSVMTAPGTAASGRWCPRRSARPRAHPHQRGERARARRRVRPISDLAPARRRHAEPSVHRHACRRADRRGHRGVRADRGERQLQPGRLGRIAVGRLADLVLVDTSGPHHLGADHPVPALALHGRAADVAMVIVDGQVVVDHGELVGVDEAAMADNARKARTAIAAHH